MRCALSWPHSSPNDPKNATPHLKAGGYGAMPSGGEAAEGGGGAPWGYQSTSIEEARRGRIRGESAAPLD